MGTITYHLVHLHAAHRPVLATPDSRWDNFRAAYAYISAARARFRRKPNGLLTHARFPLSLRWSDDDGETLHELPDAYDYGHYDGGTDGMSHDESYITAVERGMRAIAAQLPA